ncbi:MAG TPA: hypothetical protein VE442_25200 [Jatrophihabitans sp.]|jgi:hypothetical protein|nr:hypothetical protein [Jatrophihabitans sp.]
MTLTRRIVTTAGAATLLLGMGTATAQAAPIIHENFHDTESTVMEDFCGDLTVRLDIDVTGTVLANLRGPNHPYPYFVETDRGTISYTNLATDKAFTSVFDTVSKDQTITDNGDGTITLISLSTGNQVWYGPDGTALLREPGQIRVELLIDTNGTPSDPDDDVVVADLGLVKGSTGRNDTAGRDFCDDLHEFTS